MAGIFLVATTALLAFYLCRILYRLYFHPLARFPGPKIAAATGLYEFYYDAIKMGQYVFEIKEMHRKYGHIVRISPDELHMNDPDFIDELYTGTGKRRDKYHFYTGQFGFPDSTLTSINHDLHRSRRAALAPFFSSRSVNDLAPMIQGLVDRLVTKLRGYAGTETPVVLNDAFSCLTTDIITQYAFGKSYNYLENNDFSPNLRQALRGLMMSVHYLKQAPWLMRLMNMLPDSVMTTLDPKLGKLLKMRRDIIDQVWRISRSVKDNQSKYQIQGPTIFHEILQSDMPAKEKHPNRLWQEGFLLVGAGTETTSWVMATTVYQILANPEVLQKLKQELVAANSNPFELLSLNDLERLPYLIIGMTSLLVQHNENIFPEPFRFRPERWLENPGLSRYLISFSKGSRQCLGLSLAYAELRITLATIFRSLDIELYKTSMADVEIKHDLVTACAEWNSVGIRVLVK